MEASSALEALKLLDQHPEIAVLFTDINMPGEMNGLELAAEVNARRPDIRLYMASGRERPVNGLMPAEGVFIEKPYSPIEIAERIRQSVRVI